MVNFSFCPNKFVNYLYHPIFGTKKIIINTKTIIKPITVYDEAKYKISML